MFDFVRKVAPTNAPVLILGESGTGKEMLAKAIHRRTAVDRLTLRPAKPPDGRVFVLFVSEPD